MYINYVCTKYEKLSPRRPLTHLRHLIREIKWYLTP